MQSCLHSVSLPRLPIAAVLERAKAHGYAAVELNAETLPWAAPHVTPETTAAERRAIVATARRLGLTLPALGAHIEMVDANAARRSAAVLFVTGCIDLAADLGIPIVHILSGPVPTGTAPATAWPWFAEAVTRAVEHAKTRDVTLAIEAIAGHLFHGVDDYHRLWAEVPDLDFRVNFDPSHLIVQGEDPMRVVDELSDRIVHVHLKDGAGRFPAFTFPPLGQGAIDFPQLVAGLRRAGYDGALSVEYEAQVYGFEASEEDILKGGRDFVTSLGA